MSKTFSSNRLLSLITFVKRSISIQSKSDLGMKMKLLNDKKQFNETIQLFDKYKSDQDFSSFIITQALKACIQLGNLEYGLNIHNLISSHLKDDTYILASLIHLCMQCNDIIRAESLFNKSTNKSLSMYGAMMKGYIKNNQANKAIELFNQIKNPDDVIIILLFNACAQLANSEALNLTKRIYLQIPKSFHSNPRLLTSLLDTLIKCNDITYAQSLFNKTKNKSISMYGVMMNGFVKIKKPFKTLDLFNQMKNDKIQINNIISTCIIKALSQIGDYELSKSILEQIPKSCFIDNQIFNVLIDMWGKTGCVDRAKEIFEKLSQPDRIGYGAMINAYGLNGMGIQAIEIYYQMPTELINEGTYICIINACSHSGLVDQARSIFQNIQNKTERIYTSMIDCLSRASLFQEAQQLIDEFEQNHSASVSNYMALLSGARNKRNIHLSEQIFHRIKKLFPELTDSLISASILLANVYGSLDHMEKASDIRNQLTGAKKKIGLSWTVINGQVYQFRAHDKSHPRSSEIYAEIKQISNELLEHGHQYDSSWITRPLNDNETIASVLCGHSEKLAIAWNFVENPTTSRIQLTNYLRVCGDCHRAIKLIAAIRRCEIVVRDSNRIHHFYKNGQCSCNDYF